MAARALRALPAPAGSGVVTGFLSQLEAALAGTGPALLPLPADLATAGRLIGALRPHDPEAPLEHDDIALVVPTTGSTGDPKGALLTATALTASAGATSTRLGGPGRWLLALPLTHIAGLQVLTRSLLAGTTPVAVDLSRGFRPADFVDASQQLSSTPRRYTALVPTQLRRLLDAGGAAVEALASYDAVLLGGAAAVPTMLQRAADANVRVVTTYGMSETCGGCVYDGRALDGVDVIVDTGDRIAIRGPVVFAGYRLRPDLTAAALTEGWFGTGDLGRLDGEGRLEVLGRADDVVVSGGENVALSAVEAAVAAHPSVREAAALGVPDEEWGQRVVVAVVPRSDAPSLGELRSWVTARLGVAAAPSDLLVLAALPLAGPGKVDRHALAALAGATAA